MFLNWTACGVNFDPARRPDVRLAGGLYNEHYRSGFRGDAVSAVFGTSGGAEP